MYRYFLPFIALFICYTSGFSATGDTTIITAHTLTNLNSPPSNDDIWVVFPNTSVSYQKIIMKFTLGCGTPQCSGWDYTVNTSIGKKNGAVDSSIVAIDTLTQDTTWAYTDHVNFTELGRLITPYGTYMASNSNGFNGSWTHPYYYDVSDFAALLKDSTNVRVHYDGWTDAFSAKIEFIFIEGPLLRTVENIEPIYNGYFGYANSADFENQAVAKTFPIHASVTSAKVKIIMTGHGSQGEFDPHYIQLKVNSNLVYERLLWKEDCDVNPIAPQGGTWIYHRANWCPGDKVPTYEIDITPYITPGQNATIDLDLDDYTVQSGQSAGYGISAYLITYTEQKDNDVMLEEIIAPNKDKPYLHWNPISTQPKVVIKNTGKNNLSYAEIKYWVKGGNYWYYEWTGNLLPFQSEQITLPAFDWFGMDTTDRIFYAEAKWPNQVPDEYVYNNKLESHFDMAPKLDSVFFIYFKTNNHPEENWYTVKNENGDTLRLVSYPNGNTIHRDTLHLSPGSYSFDMFDLDSVNWGCGDGISWYVNTQNGYESSGLLRLYKLGNQLIKTFNGDFGGNIHYEFTVGYPLGYNPPKQAPSEPVHNAIAESGMSNYTMQLFPNPASSMATVKIELSRPMAGSIIVTDLSGRRIRSIATETSTNHYYTLQTETLARGTYFISFVAKELKITKRLIVE